MHSAILINRKENACALKQYLVQQSTDFEELQILEKNDVFVGSKLCRNIRYLFSTWDMPKLSKNEIADHFPSLEAIFYAAGDISYFSIPFEQRGVKIFSAQFENSIPVAEFVVAQVILANKGYFQAHNAYKSGFWRLGFKRARAMSLRKPGNIGSTVGIIGLGTIGSLVAKKLKSFDLKIAVYDPYVDEDKIQNAGAVRAGLEELFESCDVISNHLPDILDTRKILGYRHFSAMKQHATFINTGRGRQVDEKGFVKAMRESPTKAALLDVTRREPPDPISPLYRTRNIFLSPHIAGSQGNEVDRLYEAAYRQYLEYQITAGSNRLTRTINPTQGS